MSWASLASLWLTQQNGGFGPNHSRISLRWLACKAPARWVEYQLHVGNGPEGAAESAPFAHGWVSPRHIYSLPVTQLPVPQPELGASVQAMHEDMEQDEEYLRVSCGNMLITKWEWECVKRTNLRAVGAVGWANALNVSWPLDRCRLPVLGNDLQSSCIHKDWVFGLAQVDIHTLQGLKDEFLDLLSILTTTAWSWQDASPHMAEYCEASGVMTSWRFALNSSYFAHQTLIPTPVLCQHLLRSLVWLPCMYIRAVCPAAHGQCV